MNQGGEDVVYVGLGCHLAPKMCDMLEKLSFAALPRDPLFGLQDNQRQDTEFTKQQGMSQVFMETPAQNQLLLV